MKNEEQVQIYRVSFYNKESGRLVKRKIYQSHKAFIGQSKRRCFYKNFCNIDIVCERLNADGVFELTQDE